MIEKMATVFIEIQYQKGIIQKDDINIYRYGYILMMEVLLNICFTFLIGVLLGNICEAFFFLCIFAPLRSFCGGYHADKVWKCNILSNCVVAFVITMSKLMAHYKISQLAQIVVMILVVVLIVLLAPVETQNRKLNMTEKRVLKRSAILVLIIELLIEIVLLFKGKSVYYYIVMLAHVVQIFSIIVALYTKHRR